MWKVLLVILLAGVFLGGYYVGRLPGSPDLIDWAEKTLDSASRDDWKAKGLSPAKDNSFASQGEKEETGKILVEIEGKTYLIGE